MITSGVSTAELWGNSEKSGDPLTFQYPLL